MSSRENVDDGLAQSQKGNSRLVFDPFSPRLPFEFEVLAKTFLHTALPLGIICRNGKKLTGPIFEYHVQLFFPHTKFGPGGDGDHFRFIPDLCAVHLAKLGYLEICPICSIAKEQPALADTLVEKIRAGSYIHLWVDDFFVPNTKSYNVRHRRHALLLIGCDREGNRFLGVTYVRSGVLAEVWITREELVASLNMELHALVLPNGAAQVEELRPKRDPVVGKIRGLVSAQLSDYIRGANNLSDYRDGGKYAFPDGSGVQIVDAPGSYGIQTYSAICTYLKIKSAKKETIDLRVTRLLWEHKKMLLEALLQGAIGSIPEPLIQSFGNVVLATHKIHLRALQLTMRHLPQYYESLIPLFDAAEDAESRAIKSMLELSEDNGNRPLLT